MAYNPQSDVNAIYKLKGDWAAANAAGNKEAQNQAAAQAQDYYNNLRRNGYGNVADELTASNYEQAKSINDKWLKMGKTSTRPYLYSLGASKGMSSADVDKLISWDNHSGEVSFGGKKIGTPDAVVDGVSYWNDTSILDDAFNDYISRSGTALSNSQTSSKNSESIKNEIDVLSSQNSESIKNKIDDLWAMQNKDHSELSDMYKQEYDDIKKTNPFETDEAKSILAKYDLAGLQGRDNEVASGAGSNSGNIDSFAAANALRQQTALVNQGQEKVLSAYQQKLDNARAILENLGIYQQNNYSSMQNTIGLQQNEAQRLFENSETAKDNDVARKSEIASVTGYTPTEWSIKNDAFLVNFVDEDGKLKPEYYNTDFQSLINSAKASGNTELANKYSILRGLKIFGNFAEYGKYLNEGDIAYMTPQQTEPARQFNDQIASDRELSRYGIEVEQALANASNDTERAAILFQYGYHDDANKLLGASGSNSTTSGSATGNFNGNSPVNDDGGNQLVKEMTAEEVQKVYDKLLASGTSPEVIDDVLEGEVGAKNYEKWRKVYG